MGLRPLITVTIDASGPTQMLNLVGENLGNMGNPISDILRLELLNAKGVAESGTASPGMSSFTANPPELLQRIGMMHPRNPATLLRDTGAFAASLEPGGPNNILTVGPSEGEAGSSDPKALLLQEGTSRTFAVLQFVASRGRTRIYIEPGMPARQIIGFDEARGDQYDAILVRHVFGGLDES